VNYLNQLIYEMHEYPEQLALDGHEVHCLHFPENYPYKNKIKFKFSKTNVTKIKGRVEKKADLSLITPLNFGGFAFERYIHPLICIPIVIKLIRKKYDIVILYSAPTNGWQAAIIAKIYKIPIIFRAIDVLHLLRDSKFWPIIKVSERIVYHYSNLILANSESLKKYIQNMSKSNIKVMYPPLDTNHLVRKQRSLDISNKLGIKIDDTFNIVFLGTLYKFSGLIQCIQRLIEIEKEKDISNINFLIYGDGELMNEIKKIKSQNRTLFNIVLAGRIEYLDIPEYLSIANVAINPFVPQEITNKALPHKVLQYMSCGVPTITTNLDGLKDAIDVSAGLLIVDSPEKCMDEAINLSNKPHLLGEMSAKHTKFIQEKYTAKSNINFLYENIQKLQKES
jgi:glycosyltransferase involved in cell wall biosynthesis